jgi:hypothetical protein
MAYLIAGPLVALVGIVSVFFVLRRKSVEKRSMYSARRSQIEHKVRAARQRTLTPRGRSDRHAAPTAMIAEPTMEAPSAQPTMTWETPAYSAPPVAPPPPSQPIWETPGSPAPTAAPMPWDPPSAPAPEAAPADPGWSPPAPEPFRPAPEPTPMAPSEQAWTPAPVPATEPVAPLKPAASSASATAAGSWEVVSADKGSAVAAESDGKKRKGGDTSQWELASGEPPRDEADEPEAKRPAGNLMAIAQYAILVVGLVMVLIGVLVMVANSHVT